MSKNCYFCEKLFVGAKYEKNHDRFSTLHLEREAIATLTSVLPLKHRKHQSCCQAEDIARVLIYSATHHCSIESACNRLGDAPNADTVFDNLRSNVSIATLQERINTALGAHFPKATDAAFYHLAWHLAADCRDIPYYGTVTQGTALYPYIHCSRAKQGTHHFLRYLLVSIVNWRGERQILALVFCRRQRPLRSHLQKALKIVRSRGIRIGSLALDKQFYAVKILRSLQTQGIGFVVPVVLRGRKNSRLHGIMNHSRHTEELSYRMRSGKESVKFRLVIVHKYLKGRYGKHKRQKYAYAVWGLDWLKPKETFGFYRHRFGIESDHRSNKSMNIRTCSRRVEVRVLAIAVGFLLMNLWLWVKATHQVERQWKRKFTLLLCWTLVALYIASLYKPRDIAVFLKL